MLHSGQNKAFRIAVCFKITDDYDELTYADWDVRDEQGFPKTDFVKRIIGCFDEAALENALLLKEAIAEGGGEAEVCAVTINPGYAEHILRRLAAVGFDEIVCIHSKDSLDFQPEVTAEILARFFTETKPDLILCGGQAAPGGSGKVPALIAQTLNRPLKLAVTRLHFEHAAFFAVCEYAKEYISCQLQRGTVCAIGNAERSYLRIPTLREKMKTKNFVPVERMEDAACGQRSYSFMKVCRERSCRMETVPLAIAQEICLFLEQERNTP